MSAKARQKLDKYIGVYMEEGSEKRRAYRGGKPDYCFYIDYIGADGKKKWKRIGWQSDGFTAQYASGVRAEIVKAIRLGDETPYKKKSRTITMNEAWAVYAEKHLPTMKNPQCDEGRYRNHIAPMFGDTPLDQITTLDLETFKQALLQKKTFSHNVKTKGNQQTEKCLTPASVKHIIKLIRGIYNRAASWGLYEGKSPITNFKMPKVDNARFRYLTTEQAKELLEALAQKEDKTWWNLASISLNTGMRLGEILALTGSDINLDAGIIYIRDAKAGSRMAPMTEDCKRIFAAILPENPGQFIFTNKFGQPMRSNNTSNLFTREIEKLGFNDGIADPRQKVVFHTLRHTYASWMAIDGVPLYTISELMGHKSLDMTQRYAHLCPVIKQTAVSSISKRLHS